MKIQTIILLMASSITLTNCTIIFGGAKYQAHIDVLGHPDTEIYCNNEYIGQGNATFKVKRKQADKLHFKLKEIGCEEYTQSFTVKKARPLALIGTIAEASQIAYDLTQNGTVSIPLGTILDLLIGSYWRPNINDPLIHKIDYDNFKYILKYPTCPEKPMTNIPLEIPVDNN